MNDLQLGNINANVVLTEDTKTFLWKFSLTTLGGILVIVIVSKLLSKV